MSSWDHTVWLDERPLKDHNCSEFDVILLSSKSWIINTCGKLNTFVNKTVQRNKENSVGEKLTVNAQVYGYQLVFYNLGS